MTAPAVKRRRIMEVHVPGKGLGRHVEHDPRSLAYLEPESDVVVTVWWKRETPILDQGDVGSCTGNATVGALGTDPFYGTLSPTVQGALNEALAQGIYSDAETIDGDGPYPPNDNGSSGLSAAKAALKRGLINGYTHMTSIAACHGAIQQRPFITGVNWYTSMDSPTAEGIVEVSGTVRGGHEFACYGYDAQRDLWWFDNSWGTSFGHGGAFAIATPGFQRLLGEDGDATLFTPISQPAPVPTPTPAPVTVDYQAAVNQLLAKLPKGWETAKHVGDNAKAAKAVHALRVEVDG